MKHGLVCLIIASVIACHVAVAQDSTTLKSPLSFSIGTYINYGFIFAHSDKVQNTANAFPIGFTTALNWQRTDRQDFDLYRCLPRHSLLIAYYNFDKAILGKGVNISYSLEPHFMLSEKLSLYPKFSAGLGILSNPHDSISNPTNGSYSLPVNVYLALGVGLRWQFSKQWSMNLATEYQHISNGGLYKPNVGMNFPTVGIGVEYSPQGLELKKFVCSRGTKETFRSRRLDVQIFGVTKYGDFTGTGKHYPIMGLNFTGSWRVSRIHAWTAAAEAYQDQYLQERASTEGVVSSGSRIGVLAGHEFLLGKYIFSQQIGMYLAGSHHNDLVYHRWGLLYFFKPKWSVGFNMLVHRQTADFTDLRVTYSFFRK